MALPADVQAQIYSIVDTDGSMRYTSEYEPGAVFYLETYYTRRPLAQAGLPFAGSIESAAAANDLPPELLEAVIAAESDFDPNAISSKGAQGLMQLMPATAAELGVDDVWNPDENIHAGSRYLAELMHQFDRDLPLALAAYNAGPQAVRRHEGVPPYAETRAYVARVLDYYRKRRAEHR